jgi:hypothetical protein
MEGFEYTTLSIQVSVSIGTVKGPNGSVSYPVQLHPADVAPQINRLASDGWELVNVVSVSPSIADKNGTFSPGLLLHYFKRPRQGGRSQE